MSRTTDKYLKIKKQNDTAPEHEIRIRAIPQIGRYISYAASLLLEKNLDKVLIKASGNAVRSACQIAEILRHRIANLHQLNELKTISVVDEYEPKEEGLDRVVVERKLAVLEITLSLKESVLDTKAPGYQAPLPKDQVQEEELKNILAGRRGGDRGGPRPPRRGDRGGRRGGYRGGDREDRGDRGGDREDRGERGGYREDRGDRGGYREDRGDRGDRGGYRGGRGGYREDRGDRGERGGYRGGRGGDRGDRGDREDRGDRGDREDRGERGGRGFRRGRYAGPRVPRGEGRGGRGGRGGDRGDRGGDREDRR